MSKLLPSPEAYRTRSQQTVRRRRRLLRSAQVETVEQGIATTPAAAAIAVAAHPRRRHPWLSLRQHPPRRRRGYADRGGIGQRGGATRAPAPSTPVAAAPAAPAAAAPGAPASAVPIAALRRRAHYGRPRDPASAHAAPADASARPAAPIELKPPVRRPAASLSAEGQRGIATLFDNIRALARAGRRACSSSPARPLPTPSLWSPKGWRYTRSGTA